jgi:Leucine-rich repeat (LRR) protein
MTDDSLITEKSLAKPRKRRFLSFSLRTLLIVTLVIGCLLGWQVNKVNRQRKAIQTILALGGHIYFENDSVLRTETIPPSRMQKWLEKFLPNDYIYNVYGVVINEGQDVGNASFIADIPHLKSLYLDRTNVSDLSALSGLTDLKKLTLWATKVKDLTPLASLKNLEYLNLEMTPVESIAPLHGLEKLEYLSLYGTKIRDISSVSSMKSLTYLRLLFSPLEDIRGLGESTSLVDIDLSDTQVSDISSLSKLKTLRNLSLSRTLTRLEDVAALQKQLPGCQITNNRTPLPIPTSDASPDPFGQ